MITSRAPLRISFAGGGSDIPAYYQKHGGAVLNATIAKYAHCTISDGSKDSTAPQRSTMQYWSDVTPGSGLGSSSALAVAIVAATSKQARVSRTAEEHANLAYHLERDYLQIPGGMQDFYSAAYGGMNLIEFTPHGRITVVKVPTPEELFDRLFLVDTGEHRPNLSLVWRDVQSCSKQSTTLAKQQDVVYLMLSALEGHHLAHFGELLELAWLLKQTFSPDSSTDRASLLYQAAKHAGCQGGKLCGAGGGGHLLLYVPLHAQDAVANALAALDARMEQVVYAPQGVEAYGS